MMAISALFLSCGDDGDEKELPTLSVADVTLAEGNGESQVQVTIELSQAVDFEISLEAQTRTNTATEEDFVAVDTLLRIDAGVRSVPINITILGDDDVEEDESFLFVLLDPFNATLDKDVAIITLTNDDEHAFNIPTTGFESPESYEGMTLVWEDDFDGDAVDLDTWTFDNGDGCNQGICGWGNQEAQYYQENNTSLIDGNLVIEAREQSRGGLEYTSSKLITKDKRSFHFGRIDIRAVMPEGEGMWPALWMMGTNIDEVGWPACGEIDIMELFGAKGDNKVEGTVHWDNAGNYAQFGGNTTLESGTFNDNFHVYSIVWDETAIRWLLDDEQYHVIDITPGDLEEFQREFYMLINVAVGGDKGAGDPSGTTFPQWMIIDYIRYFEPN